MKEINVLLYGLGPIGLEVFKSCTRSNNITVIGGVDIDPNKVGKDLGEIAGLSNTGIKVTSSLSNIPHGANHSVALHTTGSSVPQVWPQIKSLLDHGYSVVSSCEELSFPWVRYPELAKEIDQYAKDKGLLSLEQALTQDLSWILLLYLHQQLLEISRVFTFPEKWTFPNGAYLCNKKSVLVKRWKNLMHLQKKIILGMSDLRSPFD